jgi:hypothetical protein
MQHTILILSIGALSPVSTTSSFTTTASNFATTQQPSSSGSPSKNKALIPGVVVGSVVGTTLVIAIVWYCLRTRKNKKTGQNRGTADQDQGGGYQYNSPEHIPKASHPQMAMSSPQSWQQQTGYQNEYMIEAPGSTTTRPAELWQGNYKP